MELVLDDGDKVRSSTETFELSTDSGELPITSMESVAEEKKREKPNAVAEFLAAHKSTISILIKLTIHALIIVYFAFATKHYVTVTNGEQVLDK